jgi:Homing endonuclease associated repeat
VSQALGGVLASEVYDEYASTRRFRDGRPWPTRQTHILRYGSWRKAMHAAGLTANPSSPITGKRLFEVGHCVDAVRHVSRDLGKVPTAAEYEQVASDCGGALPSLATVRNRCGTWSHALQLAGL